MKYENQSSDLLGEKHLWKNEQLSVYAWNKHGNLWEIELGLCDYEGNNLNVYRIENTASFQEATEIITNLLEVFEY